MNTARNELLIDRAEHSAIAAMVTAGEYRISAIVAVWRGERDALHVLPPYGRCREFIRQVDPGNLDTDGGSRPRAVYRAGRAAPGSRMA